MSTAVQELSFYPIDFFLSRFCGKGRFAFKSLSRSPLVATLVGQKRRGMRQQGGTGFKSVVFFLGLAQIAGGSLAGAT